MKNLPETLSHTLDRAKEMLSNAHGWFIMIGSMLCSLPDPVKSISALLIVWGMDMLTGSYASWCESRKTGKTIKVYHIESTQLRKSVTKGISYLQWIFFSWIITALFIDQKFNLAYSSKAFSVTEFTIGFCIAIEIWSNIENSKRAGFDIIAKTKDASKTIWKLVRTVKSGE